MRRGFSPPKPFSPSATQPLSIPETVKSDNHPMVTINDFQSRPGEHMEGRSLLSTISDNYTVIYIHVGKTGGTTLDSVLRSNCHWYSSISAQNRCIGLLDHMETDNANKTVLSALTKATLHMDPNQDFHHWLDDADAFLVTIRDPITRAVSAFNMHHPNNTLQWRRYRRPPKNMPLLATFYVRCFPTVEHLARVLALADAQDDCYNIGVHALSGNSKLKVVPHLQYNYAFYHQRTLKMYPGRPVFVLRTDHLWEDLANVDTLLGGSGDFVQKGEAQTWGSERFHVHQGLSSNGTQILCCFLANELEIYEKILLSAVNLSPLEKETTLTKLYDHCGLEERERVKQISNTERRHFPWSEWVTKAASLCPPDSRPAVWTQVS